MVRSSTSREALWGMLYEAAEIEHNLMCCYLYGAFSLKDGGDGDLSAEELDRVRYWRGEIMAVAVEEMIHLANVSNILSGLGAPAHFSRPNFPVAAGYHPAGVVVKLAPFSMETLDHFIYLERPDTVSMTDGAGFEPEHAYRRDMKTDRMTPVARDYSTVGQLYAAILAGMEELAGAIGEDALFLGDPRLQISPEVATLPDVKVVRCLKTARQAIEAIVLQGEGAAEGATRSHYQRFLAVREEFKELLRRRPDFRPAHPAAHNPVMRRPVVPEGRIWVKLEPAASLLDLANALYNQSMRCLALGYAGMNPASQRALIATSIELMHLLTPIAERLARLPANEEHPHCTAGISFATLRSLAALPAMPAALDVLAERLDDLADRAAGLTIEAEQGRDQVLICAKRLTRLAERLRETKSEPLTPEIQPMAPAPSSKGPPVPTPREDGFEAIPGNSLTLIYSAKRCIHARHCVLGLPEVFKANVEGPWIDPTAASTEALLTVAHMCPSGAIQYERNDGGEEESPPPVNLLQLRENGPLGFRAEIRLDGKRIGMRATLCRCGASRNKPFCDGSHAGIDFQATGEPQSRPCQALIQRGGLLDIEPETNGPLAVTGNLEICAGTGRTVDKVTSARLCRCGGSANKPFCDNTHRLNGFRG